MSKSNQKIEVNGIEISIIQKEKKEFICITDIAKTKGNSSRAADIIKNWIRNRSTIEFIGTWEQLYNPNFKVVEFDHFKMQAGLHSFVLSPAQWIEKTSAIGIYANEADLLNVALFGKTAKEWKDEFPKKEGNIRDIATLEQLVVLSNMESINALLIQQNLSQSDRIIQLNKVAISQMKSLVENRSLKKLQ